MKYNCEMIRDLLPLYKDQACSKASADIVEEHLAECSDCTKLLEDMNSFNIEDAIVKERNEVINTQAKFFKRRSALAGAIIGGLFTLPILICLIVDLASGSGLSWFFIVLAAMLIPVSLIVVPLMVPRNKGLWTLSTFTVSLLALLGVCCIYSRGDWFLTAALPVIFGLSVVFTPFVVRTKPVAEKLGNNKLLAVVSVYTLTYAVMMIWLGIKSKDSAGFFRMAAACSLPALTFMWGLFALIRLPKWNGYIKAATCILFSALLYLFSDAAVMAILGMKPELPKFAMDFSTSYGINNSVSWIVLIAGAALAAVMAIIGFTRKNRGNVK